MKREIIRVEPFDSNFEKWGAPVSTCTRAGDLVFISGLPPFDPKTAENLVNAPFERQAERILEHGKRIVGVLCPATLPYKIGTFASFDYVGINGRALGDDVMDVMLTLAANQALSDGVAPARQRTRGEFPYFGEPYTHDDQHGVSPAAQPTTK